MEVMVNALKTRFRNQGLQDACLEAYKSKLGILNALGFNFAADNPRILIETNSKEEQLLQRLDEYPYQKGFSLSNIFWIMMEINGIRSLKLDANNNIVMPSGLSIRLSVFTKYCRDTDGTPYFNWQEINSFNIGCGLYLTIHPVDFANCSNHEDGITSWSSCFSPHGDYAASPYAYINSPYTIMVMKGNPDRIQGRMWLHLLQDPTGNKIAGYCLMRSYGASFTEEERERIQLTICRLMDLHLEETDSCSIVTNNEISAEQTFEVSSHQDDFYVYFDPIVRAYVSDTFIKNTEAELSLHIQHPFDSYGDDIYSCNEFHDQDDEDNDAYCDCYHCDEAFNYEAGDGRYLDNYNRNVCNGCLDEYYTLIGDDYIWHENVVDVYEVSPGSEYIDCYAADNSDDSIEFDEHLGEYVAGNCLHFCEECGGQHADYSIYEHLEIDYPCDETEEDESFREQETIELVEFETIESRQAA